jgi:hypothetical protein
LLAAIMSVRSTKKIRDLYDCRGYYGEAIHSRGIVHDGWLFLAAAPVGGDDLELIALPLASVAGLNGRLD